MRLRVRRDHVPYDVWVAEGCLKTTEGNVIHYGFIEHLMSAMCDPLLQCQFHQFFCRWTHILISLSERNNGKSHAFKVLRWMMDNVFVRQDPAGNIKMDKEKSTEKIDGAVATVMALDRAIRNEGSDGSVYDDRGILVF